MAVGDLRGPAVTAAVVGDHPEPLAHEEKHLIVPVVRRQRPPMAEDDRPALPPVLVEDLDPVLGPDCAHGASPFLWRVVTYQASCWPRVKDCGSSFQWTRSRDMTMKSV